MSPAGRRPFPPPPADLAARSLPMVRYGGSLYRIHPLSIDPLQPSTRDHRFSGPDLGFATLYAATDEVGAFAETALPRFSDTFAASGSWFRDRGMAVVTCASSLELVDLTADGLAALGADGRIFTLEDYGRTQPWAQALFHHPAKPDGLYYLACSAPRHPSVALFDRALHRLRLEEDRPFEMHPGLVDHLARTLNLAIIPDY